MMQQDLHVETLMQAPGQRRLTAGQVEARWSATLCGQTGSKEQVRSETSKRSGPQLCVRLERACVDVWDEGAQVHSGKGRTRKRLRPVVRMGNSEGILQLRDSTCICKKHLKVQTVCSFSYFIKLQKKKLDTPHGRFPKTMGTFSLVLKGHLLTILDFSNSMKGPEVSLS